MICGTYARVVRFAVEIHTFEDTVAFLVAHDVMVHFYTFYTSPASVPRSVARRQMQMVAFVRLFRDFDFFTRFCESPAAGPAREAEPSTAGAGAGTSIGGGETSIGGAGTSRFGSIISRLGSGTSRTSGRGACTGVGSCASTPTRTRRGRSSGGGTAGKLCRSARTAAL